MDNQLTTIIESSQLDKTKAQIILDQFTGFMERASALEAKARSIVVTDENQTDKMEEAKVARLELKNIRVNAEKTRVALKEQSLREGKAIDGIANVIKAIVVPIEEYLEKQEKFAEEKQKEREFEKYMERCKLLQPYVEHTDIYHLKAISDEAFEALLIDRKKDCEQKQEYARIQEEARIKKEKEEQEERERIRIENEKLKKELAEKEAKEKKEKEEQEKIRQAEKAKADAILAKEKAEKEKLEKELKDKKDEEARIKKEQEAEQKRIKKEQEDKLKAPDKEKLKELGLRIVSLELPECQSEEGKNVLKTVNEMLSNISAYIRENTINL